MGWSENRIPLHSHSMASHHFQSHSSIFTCHSFWGIPSIFKLAISSSWWFQPLWKILVSLDDFSEYMEKVKVMFQSPPTTHYILHMASYTTTVTLVSILPDLPPRRALAVATSAWSSSICFWARCLKVEMCVLHVHLYLSTRTYTHTRIFIYIYIYTDIHMCISIYDYICIHTHTFRN